MHVRSKRRIFISKATEAVRSSVALVQGGDTDGLHADPNGGRGTWYPDQDPLEGSKSLGGSAPHSYQSNSHADSPGAQTLKACH